MTTLDPTALARLTGSAARPARTRGESARDAWRSFQTAVRLGVATEANWADPVLFIIYSIAKPITPSPSRSRPCSSWW